MNVGGSFCCFCIRIKLFQVNRAQPEPLDTSFSSYLNRAGEFHTSEGRKQRRALYSPGTKEVALAGRYVVG